MLHCPRCQSPNIASGKLNELYLTRAMQFAHAAQKFENKRLTAIGGIAALAVKAVDVLFKDYRCTDCGYRFDA
jgi:predicted Zn-ribbon and HTH transcriptional regulator